MQADPENDVSWTGFVIASVARAVSLHPELNARRACGRLVCFDRVDIGATIERGTLDRPALDVVVVPAADRLTCTVVTALLHRAKVGPAAPHEVTRPMAAVLRLPLTLTFDHAVVDGAPAARFVETLRDLVETAAALDGTNEGVPRNPAQMSRNTSGATLGASPGTR